MVGAIVTYIDNGTRRPCGQTVGADGKGLYAVVFESDNIDAAEEEARSFIKKLEASREYFCHYTEIHLVIAGEYFSGPSITYKTI